MKLISAYTRILFIFCAIFTISCGSGEYEINQYKVDYTEKTLVVDTISVVVNDDNIKEDITDSESRKYNYNYVVQIGAFVIKDNFDRFYAKAKQDLGPDVYYELINTLYKIRLGSFTNRAEAVILLEKVKAIGYYDAFVITTRRD